MSENLKVVSLPVEVEDLIADQGNALDPKKFRLDGAAGHAVIASAAPGPAYLFRVESGGARDAVPIDLPRSQILDSYDFSPPAIALWRADSNGVEQTLAKAVGIAAITRDGTLRVYDNVVLQESAQSQSASTYREIRLASTLSASVGLSQSGEGRCWCDQVVYVRGDESNLASLMVFGSRGSAARVLLDHEVLVADPLPRKPNVDEFSSTHHNHSHSRTFSFGTKLFSALRSIGVESRSYDNDWIEGVGRFATIGVGCGREGSSHAFVFRRCGEIEKWGSESMLWTLDIMDIASKTCPQGSSDLSILRGAVSSEEILVAVLQYRWEEEARYCLLCADASSDALAPIEASLYVDFGILLDDDNGIHMIMSNDIAYIYASSARTVRWTSVATGISVESQVTGQQDLSYFETCLGGIDMLRDLHLDLISSGGRVGFLGIESISVISAQAPAPLSAPSTDRADFHTPASGFVSEYDLSCLLQRAYLQYAGAQLGACQVTAQSITHLALFSSDYSSSDEFNAAVLRTSTGIVDTFMTKEANSTPLSLLIDSQLQDKVEKHAILLQMIADPQLLKMNDSMGTCEGDRIWDFLGNEVRSVLVSNAEKLASAFRLREIQNKGVTALRTRTSQTESVLASELTQSNSRNLSVLGSIFDEDDEDLDDHDGRSIVAEALRVAAFDALRSLKVTFRTNECSEDPDVILYGLISRFECILPALRTCLRSSMRRAHEFQAENGTEGSHVPVRMRRLACRDLLFASNAALAIVQAAADVREECQATYSFQLRTLEANGGWSCDPVISRDTLRELIDGTLKAAKSCRVADARILRNCSVSLSHALLDCARNAHMEEQLRHNLSSGNRPQSPPKRRRVSKSDESSILWESERRSALMRLHESGLSDETFNLARKFEDFGLMLMLKLISPDFDNMMEAAVDEFGPDFAYFAFQWLEDRGEFKILVYGQAAVENNRDQGWCMADGSRWRSARTKKLLSQYFQRKKKLSQNVSWMVHLAHGNFNTASESLDIQAKALSIPGKPMSLPSVKSLLSMAKLAIHAGHVAPDMQNVDVGSVASAEGDKIDEKRSCLEKSAKFLDLDRRLYLIRAQHQLDPAVDVILPHDQLVKRYVDEAPVDTGKLSDNVVLALEILQKCGSSGAEEVELKSYVWRRCLERQAHFWIPIISGKRGCTDAELRGQLANTALFEVAKRIQLDIKDTDSILNCGIADCDAFAAVGRPEQLKRLIHTTVGLATEEVVVD